MEEIDKEVDFYSYCPQCKYYKLDDWEDPCDLCLENPSNTHSRKPVFYEPAVGNEQFLAPQHPTPKPEPIKKKFSRIRNSRKKKQNGTN